MYTPHDDLKYYSPEYEGLFDDLRHRAVTGQGPTNPELLCIIKWKLGRVTRKHFDLIRTHGDAIRKALELAGVAEERVEAIRRLIRLPGVKVSLASALLTACWPHIFTVLDRRALQQLKDLRYHQGNWPTDSSKWATDVIGYLDRYVPAVVRFQSENNLKDLRQADRMLWGRSVRCDIERHLG